MTLEELIDQLRRPSAYPHRVDAEIVVHQTHISVVFLAGGFAYKIKKPVELPFLDYSTLERREHFCRREVELNRRLAPDVYLDVVPLCADDQGVQVDGAGEVVEWAVKMVRLDEEDTLEAHLRRDGVDHHTLAALAEHIASFHRRARNDEEVAHFGRFEVVAQNARDNFSQSQQHVGRTAEASVFERLCQLNEAELERLDELIERRAAQRVPRDTHGDLRLDHVYIRDGEFTVVDCIEFNDAFRYADPISDMAFLVMDLEFADRRDLAAAFAAAYIDASGDHEGAELLDFYVAYRAAVRAKVEGIKATETEVGANEREEAARKARAHWLLALGRLEQPRRRPAMVLVGGLPGTGKSTLARALAERADFEVIDTDVVRKELAGLGPDEQAGAEFGQGIYTAEWSDKTYSECLRRACERLARGGRVIVDATFRSESRRRRFLEGARGLGVPGLFLVCETSAQTARERLGGRQGDVSDADWEVYEKMQAEWEEPAAPTARKTRAVSAEGSVGEVVSRARSLLVDAGLDRLDVAGELDE